MVVGKNYLGEGEGEEDRTRGCGLRNEWRVKKMEERNSLLVSKRTGVKEKGCWRGSRLVSSRSQEGSQCCHSWKVKNSKTGRE